MDYQLLLFAATKQIYIFLLTFSECSFTLAEDSTFEVIVCALVCTARLSNHRYLRPSSALYGERDERFQPNWMCEGMVPEHTCSHLTNIQIHYDIIDWTWLDNTFNESNHNRSLDLRPHQRSRRTSPVYTRTLECHH